MDGWSWCQLLGSLPLQTHSIFVKKAFNSNLKFVKPFIISCRDIRRVFSSVITWKVGYQQYMIIYLACIIFLEFKLWPHICHFFLCLHLKSQLVERLPLIKFGFNSVLLFTILILSCLIGQFSWQNLLLLYLSHVILL